MITIQITGAQRLLITLYFTYLYGGDIMMLKDIKFRIDVEDLERGAVVAVPSRIGLPLQEPGRVPGSARPRWWLKRKSVPEVAPQPSKLHAATLLAEQFWPTVVGYSSAPFLQHLEFSRWWQWTLGVLCDATPCSLVSIYRRFRRTRRLHLYSTLKIKLATTYDKEWTTTTAGCPKIMLNYRPKGRRRLGRPLKRVLDDAVSGTSRPNSRQVMMMKM
jgi:hypothetical protein